MRILNEDNDEPVKSILLMLTAVEAKELRDAISDSLQKMNESYHTHVDDKEYEHEITFAIYTTDNINTFHERVQRLITNDS